MDEKKYDSLKLENQLCFPLYVCAKEVIRLYKPFLEDVDLTYTQYIAMMVIWDKKEINVHDLGNELYLDSGTLTPMLKKLESKGYITRARSSEDERNLIIRITDKGSELREKALNIPLGMGKCLPISSDDAKQLFVLLNKLLNNFKED